MLQSRASDDSGFDLEIWNEGFGSDFLDINTYYSSPVGQNANLNKNQIVAAREASKHVIRDETAAYVKSDRLGLKKVQFIDGFTSQIPWGTAATEPCAVDGMTSHPYTSDIYSKDYDDPTKSSAKLTQDSLDVFGNSLSIKQPDGTFKAKFVPDYRIHFPEFFSNAITTEAVLARNIAPFNTLVNKVVHGRFARLQREDGASCPNFKLMVTEFNLVPGWKDQGGQEIAKNKIVQTAEGLIVSEKERNFLQAKALLRFYTFMINKGVDRVYFYSAFGGRDPLNLFSREVVDYLSTKSAQPLPPTLPAEIDTGYTMDAFKNLSAKLSDVASLKQSELRSLSVEKIEETHGHFQFAGSPDAANRKTMPPLYNREVLAVLPFQSDRNKFVVPLYVMTRNLDHAYDKTQSEVNRFIMPDEIYNIQIGGVDGARAQVSLYDPIFNRNESVTIVGRAGNTVTVRVAVNDSVRLLFISDERDPKPNPNPKLTPTVIPTPVISNLDPVIDSAIARRYAFAIKMRNLKIQRARCRIKLKIEGSSPTVRAVLSRINFAPSRDSQTLYIPFFYVSNAEAERIRIRAVRSCVEYPEATSLPVKIIKN